MKLLNLFRKPTLEEFRAQIRANIRRDAQEGIRQNFWHSVFVNTWGA